MWCRCIKSPDSSKRIGNALGRRYCAASQEAPIPHSSSTAFQTRFISFPTNSATGASRSITGGRTTSGRPGTNCAARIGLDPGTMRWRWSCESAVWEIFLRKV